MITLTTEAQSVLTRSYQVRVAVESWLGGVLLADDIPIHEASEEADRTLRVPERVTLTVPRLDRGTTWAPSGVDHPLAAEGQQLRVKIGIGVPNSAGMEWFQRGTFLIESSVPEGDAVNVSAVGLLALIDEARLISPFQPSGTLVSTLRALLEPALSVKVDAALTDRAVPSGINYDEDRLGAVLSLLDAWPAEVLMDPAGFLNVTPATQSLTPVLSFTDGAGGTVIRASGGSSRDGAANVVVARGTATDGGQIQGVAYDNTPGPKRYGGPFNPLGVPFFYASPLLTTVGQCNAAAATVLARLQRSASREYRVSMVPNPTLLIGDVVSLTTDEVSSLICSIEALSLPYKAGRDEPMILTVRGVS